VTTAVWTALAMILIGAFLFTWGIQSHMYGLIALGVILIGVAAVTGSRGSLPHH
jgi:hypothetical protein